MHTWYGIEAFGTTSILDKSKNQEIICKAKKHGNKPHTEYFGWCVEQNSKVETRHRELLYDGPLHV